MLKIKKQTLRETCEALSEIGFTTNEILELVVNLIDNGRGTINGQTAMITIAYDKAKDEDAYIETLLDFYGIEKQLDAYKYLKFILKEVFVDNRRLKMYEIYEKVNQHFYKGKENMWTSERAIRYAIEKQGLDFTVSKFLAELKNKMLTWRNNQEN